MNQLKYVIHALLFLGTRLLVIFFLTFIPFQPTEVPIDNNQKAIPVVNSKGKELFDANCARCHALDRDMTGPSLRGFANREPWVDRELIYEWIRNSVEFKKKYSELRDVVDKTATEMPSFSYLTKDDIDAILDYLIQEKAFPSMDVQYAVK